MHVFIAGVFGVSLWSAIVAYEALIGGPAHLFVFACPLIVSAAMAIILSIDYGLWKLQGWVVTAYCALKARS